MNAIKLLLIPGLLALLQPFANAQLVFDEPADEPVKVVESATLRARLPFQNDGSKPVAIRNILTDCPCLEASPDRGLYAPGEKGFLNLTYTPMGAQEGNLLEATLEVRTKAPDRGLYKPQVRLKAPEVFDYSEKAFVWIRSTETRHLTLTSRLNEPLTLVGVTVENGGFDVVWHTLEAGRSYRLDITPRPDGIPTLSGEIALETQSEKFGTWKSFFRGTYIDPSATPSDDGQSRSNARATIELLDDRQSTRPLPASPNSP